MTILVTGGAGFIGSNFISNWLNQHNEQVVNLDKLTYAGDLTNLKDIGPQAPYHFIQGDISDRSLLNQLFQKHQPRAVIHFAAETHVDRSIQMPELFIQTNVVGTLHLLETTLNYWRNLSAEKSAEFRFVNISTDEVYGSLNADETSFTEQHNYLPNSPYAASKAGADHLIRAWHKTYGFPTLTIHSSNNFGPRQHPEKLIPQMILKALSGKPLPIYGDGQQIRDWIYVQDTCRAIQLILDSGNPGDHYNVGANNEQTNLDTVHCLCRLLDQRCPLKTGQSYADQIAFVADRVGHDHRYAIDANKIRTNLGWRPIDSFSTGLAKTVNWYINHAHATNAP